MSSFPGQHEPSSAALLRTVAAVLVVLVAGVAMGEAVKHGAVPFDTSVTRDLSRFSRSHPPFRSFMQTLTFFGSTAFLVVVVCVGAVTSFLRGAAVAARVRVLVALRLVLYTGLGAVLTTVIKTLVERPRPGAALRLVHATGWSFPSGHATNSTIVYGALVLWFGAAVPRRRLTAIGAVAAVLVAGVACSRLALGVHWLSDVVGGMVLGTVWLALVRPSLRPYGAAPDA